MAISFARTSSAHDLPTLGLPGRIAARPFQNSSGHQSTTDPAMAGATTRAVSLEQSLSGLFGWLRGPVDTLPISSRGALIGLQPSMEEVI